MSDCCSQTATKKKSPRKYACPVNHHDYVHVPLKTILHHIKDSWKTTLKEQGYFFCNDPECDVVYFGEDDSTIIKSELRTTIGIKEKSQEALICYCFGIRMDDVIQNKKIKNFVMQQTKKGNCSCKTSNPSGHCCLRDFP